MDALKDWIDRQKKRIITYPCTLLGKICNSNDELDDVLLEVTLWTYRKDFSVALQRSNLTSDKGWGCLIRTGQMLLQRTLAVHEKAEAENRKAADVRFCDTDEAPFSVHSMVRAISSPSDRCEAIYWSPTQTCEGIRLTVGNGKFNLNVFVANGGTVYDNEISFLLEDTAVLLLLPIRTGYRTRINQPVAVTLMHFLDHKSCVGILGGVPKRSYFIVGSYEQKYFVYLDPHCATQTAFTSPETTGKFHERSDTVPSVEWDRIDSSVVIGFYIKDPADWKDVTAHILAAEKLGGAEFLSIEKTRADEDVAHAHHHSGSGVQHKDDELAWESDEEEDR